MFFRKELVSRNFRRTGGSHVSSKFHRLFDQRLDDLRLGHRLDDLALDEDLALAVARGDPEVGLAGLARAVHHAAHHGHLQRQLALTEGNATLSDHGTLSVSDVDRADMTFSVAKTYLAFLAGVAQQQGLLPDPDEPVVARLPGIGFDTAHNRTITWTHLLTQVSEWEGNCLGLEDTVDRYRQVAHDPKPVTGVKGSARPLQPPGTYWEYNDVRINQLSLALLHLFGRALPQVFREHLLDPLGCSQDIEWVGYDTSWVDLPPRDGRPAQRVQSVPGGSHWGGGVAISARDQARLGQLMLDRGAVQQGTGTQQLIPEAWIDYNGHMNDAAYAIAISLAASLCVGAPCFVQCAARRLANCPF